MTDFGRAKVVGKAGFSTTIFAGHVSYMAPELLTPDDSVDTDELFSKKSDIYAFGMLCFKVSHVIMEYYNLMIFSRPSQMKTHLRLTMLVRTIKLCFLSIVRKSQS